MHLYIYADICTHEFPLYISLYTCIYIYIYMHAYVYRCIYLCVCLFSYRKVLPRRAASNADRAFRGGRGSLTSNVADSLPRTPRAPTVNLRAKILDFRGFDSSIILILRGGILMSTGNFPEVSSQGILAGII